MSDPALAAALLAPRAVALVGASADPQKLTARPQRYLEKHGFEGRVLPVNPRHRRIFGVPAFAALEDLPGPVDHAFLMVAASQVPKAVAACGQRGILCATILADGFAEAGPRGAALQEQVLAAARAHGVRLLGPNSMGIINVTDRVALSVNAALEAPALIPGPLSVVSHSGSLIGTLLSRSQARGLGFSKLVSVGAEVDLGVGEICDLLIDDPATGAILLFLETIRRPERIEAMARRAAAAGKPVIAYLLGRSEVGRELAASHTGALVGAHEAADAFLRDCGILRVDMLESLIEMAPLVMGARPPRRRRRRAAVMTTTGGGGAMVVDRLALAGIEVVPAPDELVAALARVGIRIGPGRLIDVTLAGARPEVVGAVLEILLASQRCDAVVVVVGSSAQFQAHLAVEPIIARAPAPKPLAVVLMPEAEDSMRRLAAAGVAAFRTPEACADGVRALFDWRRPTRPRRPPIGDLARAAELLSAPALDERSALAVFAALGIPCVESRVIEDLEALSDLGAVDRYPVVAKILSPDIAHKARVGGVIPGLADEAGLRRACRQILEAVAAAAPEAERAGIVVQPMESGVAELLVGYRVDAAVGPVVTVGQGGALVEAARAFAVRRAPVGLSQAEAMIGEVPGLAAMGGDRRALANAIRALSELARLPASAVVEAEINPLILKGAGAGVVGVDGVIVRAGERPSKSRRGRN